MGSAVVGDCAARRRPAGAAELDFEAAGWRHAREGASPGAKAKRACGVVPGEFADGALAVFVGVGFAVVVVEVNVASAPG